MKEELTQRIYSSFMNKFNGNNSVFAKKVGCDEKTIRLIFNENQGITVNLLLKIANALEITPSKLLEGIELKNESDE